MLDQALNTAKQGRPFKHLDLFGDRNSGGLAAGKMHREDVDGTTDHLTCPDRVPDGAR